MSKGQTGRWWWTKRLLIVWVLLVVAILAMRGVWLCAAQRRYEAAVAPIEARGETVSWAALNAPAPPPDQNRAPLYERAMGAIDEGPGGWRRWHDLRDSPAFRREHADEADALLAANEAVFADVRAARSRPAMDWGILHVTPASDTPMPPLSRTRELTRLLSLQAARQAERGNLPEALETLRDSDVLAHSMAEGDTLIALLVGVSCHALNAGAVAEVASHLPAPADQPAAPAAVRTLIAELLDDRVLTAAQRAFRGERNWSDDTRGYMIEAGDPDLVSSYLVYYTGTRWAGPVAQGWMVVCRPALVVDQALVLEYLDTVPSALAEPTLVRARARVGRQVPDVVADRSALNQWAHIGIGWGDSDLPLYPVYAGVGHQRMAAVAMALGLYEMEQGQPAPNLEALVPEYLPAVPIDPTDPGEGPIRALLHDVHPRLYICGYDGVDGGGDREGDVVLYLDPLARPEVSLMSVAPTPLPGFGPTPIGLGPTPIPAPATAPAP